MFCKKCGAEIADNAAFCPKCGEKTNQASGQGNPYSMPNGQPYGGSPYGGYQPAGGYGAPKSASKAPGMVLLIVAGILVLIGGIIILATDLKAVPYMKYLGGAWSGALAIEIILGIFMIVAGICSLIYCGKKEKGGLVYGMGIAVVILRIVVWILAAALFSAIGFDGLNAASVILGLICPVLIVVGGYMNKRA